jgi:chromosome segregation ATPase
MAVKGIKETEKVAVGAIRTALQTWLAPQLSEISQRLTHVEARLDGIDRRFEGIDKRLDLIDKRIDGMDVRLDRIDKRIDGMDVHLNRMDKQIDGIDKRLDGMDKRIEIIQQQMGEQFRSMHNEFEARIDAVRSDIKRLDNIAELRERLASVEAKLAQHN